MNNKDNKKHNSSQKSETPEVEAQDLDLQPELTAQDIEDKVTDKEDGLDNELARQLEETTLALEKEKKEYLFLMADFDNYRKRVVKEKADLIRNAAEKTLLGLLPIVDDFERGLNATKDSDDAQSVREGMILIYNKLVKYLNDNGVQEMPTIQGTDFNPDIHEAIATIPAPAEDLKGKIIDTTQKGYTINDKVLRHAKVVVGE